MLLLIDRYQQLAVACFTVLAVYVVGLAQALGEVRAEAIESSSSSFPRSRRTTAAR